MKTHQYSVCSKCGAIVDSCGKPVKRQKTDNLISLLDMSSTICKDCTDYQNWENEKYFSKAEISKSNPV